MAAITSFTKIDVDGTLITWTQASAASVEDTFVNDGKVILLVFPDDTVDNLVVTVTTPATHRGLALSNPATTAVTTDDATASVIFVTAIGPFNPEIYNSGGKVTITATGTNPESNLKYALLRIP